ncbi:hypothetical protein H634G_03251 [Metarhizium anisopliae BRIP 53293]|uniref:Uncharacterized protein n=1 Tax=Metarhizium anisopliae BRIP 53293 TaxID=1291518 RepID=A0A0D9P6T2_METAN|nr:hypothetical protein H634G_03251 [Metarhizium anisopliae BRIP 53293]KJK95769.1 hypothetical protein H633G_00342 [Metarhizium anisopliae BRIP 53284]
MECDEVLVVAKCSQEGGAFDMKLSLSYYRSRQECVTAALEAMEPDPRNKLHVWAPEVTVLAGFDEVLAKVVVIVHGRDDRSPGNVSVGESRIDGSRQKSLMKDSLRGSGDRVPRHRTDLHAAPLPRPSRAGKQIYGLGRAFLRGLNASRSLLYICTDGVDAVKY